MTSQTPLRAAAAAVAVAAAMDINARHALLVRDALSPRSNVKRYRIILGQRISTHLAQ